MSDIRSLYVHVPFCERKCPYCDFASVGGNAGQHAYVDALCHELKMFAQLFPSTRLDTIFVGGGTPSFIDLDLMERIMVEIRRGFTIEHDAEITLEANPSSTTYERACAWRGFGFNRVSIGVQSLDPAVLQFLGRVHDGPAALAAVDHVRRAGFNSINCDLIYSVPGLTHETWERTVEQIIDAGPHHICCYELTVEDGTPLARWVQRGTVKPRSSEDALLQHWKAVELLANRGYEQYEVSNFSVPGYECRHNLTYWRGGYYLAAGVGAHGHLPLQAARASGIVDDGLDEDAVAVRYWHSRVVHDYVSSVHGVGLPLAGYETVSTTDREAERLMLGLRLREGVELHDDQRQRVDDLVEQGMLLVVKGRMVTTSRGQEILDSVIASLVA